MEEFEVYRQYWNEEAQFEESEFVGSIELPTDDNGEAVHCDLEIDGVIYKPQL